MHVNRALRRVASAVCWTLAVIVGLMTTGSLAGFGVLCQTANKHEACHPHPWVVLPGIAIAVAFGVAGALLYTPKPPNIRKPWEYER